MFAQLSLQLSGRGEDRRGGERVSAVRSPAVDRRRGVDRRAVRGGSDVH